MWYKDLYSYIESLTTMASQRGNEIKCSNIRSLVSQMKIFLQWVMRFPTFLDWTIYKNQPFNILITHLESAQKKLQNITTNRNNQVTNEVEEKVNKVHESLLSEEELAEHARAS